MNRRELIEEMRRRGVTTLVQLEEQERAAQVSALPKDVRDAIVRTTSAYHRLGAARAEDLEAILGKRDDEEQGRKQEVRKALLECEKQLDALTNLLVPLLVPDYKGE